MNYYLEKDGDIIIWSENLDTIMQYMPIFHVDKYKSTELDIVKFDGKYHIKTPEIVEGLFLQRKEKDLQEAVAEARYREVNTQLDYSAVSADTSEMIDIHIMGAPDNLSKFQSYIDGFEHGVFENQIRWLTEEDISVFLTEADCHELVAMILNLHSNIWENLYVDRVKQINACTSIEELKEVEKEFVHKK